MKIETMLRALTMAQLAWHHPDDYRMRTRLDWFEMVQRIFAGITRRYNVLLAENERLLHEVSTSHSEAVFWRNQYLKATEKDGQDVR